MWAETVHSEALFHHAKMDRICSQAATPLAADWIASTKGGISPASSSLSYGHYTGHSGFTPFKNETEVPDEADDW